MCVLIVLEYERGIITMVLNSRSKNLRENQAIFRLAEHKFDKNNTKHVEYCEVFSNYTIGQVLLSEN